MSSGKPSSAMSKLAVVACIGLLLHATLCAIYRTLRASSCTHEACLLTICATSNSDRDYLKGVQQPFTYSPFEVRPDRHA